MKNRDEQQDLQNCYNPIYNLVLTQQCDSDLLSEAVGLVSFI